MTSKSYFLFGFVAFLGCSSYSLWYSLSGTLPSEPIVAIIITAVILANSVRSLVSRQRLIVRQEAERERVRNHGRDAQVRVHSVQATNVSNGGNPKLSIDLTLVLEDTQDHRMTVLYLASFLVAPRIEPGSVYSAKVDPEDNTFIVVPAWEPNELSSVEEASPRKF